MNTRPALLLSLSDAELVKVAPIPAAALQDALRRGAEEAAAFAGRPLPRGRAILSKVPLVFPDEILPSYTETDSEPFPEGVFDAAEDP